MKNNFQIWPAIKKSLATPAVRIMYSIISSDETKRFRSKKNVGFPEKLVSQYVFRINSEHNGSMSFNSFQIFVEETLVVAITL